MYECSQHAAADGECAMSGDRNWNRVVPAMMIRFYINDVRRRFRERARPVVAAFCGADGECVLYQRCTLSDGRAKAQAWAGGFVLIDFAQPQAASGLRGAWALIVDGQ